MATFRAIHPLVREAAFRHGFIPVPGDDYRVQHPYKTGKSAQLAFYKVFVEASGQPDVRRVATPGTANGTTLLFPQVPESRWASARRGEQWNPEPTVSERSSEPQPVTSKQIFSRGPLSCHGLSKLMNIPATDILIRGLSIGINGIHLNSILPASQVKILAREFGFEIVSTDKTTEQPVVRTVTTKPPAKKVNFRGVINENGSLSELEITTTDDATGRNLLNSIGVANA